MLTFNLKKKWFEKIARGEKRIEYRELKPYWKKRIDAEIIKRNGVKIFKGSEVPGCVAFGSKIRLSCVFVLGYTKKKLPAAISKIEIVNGKNTDLRVDRPVYAIHFELDLEENNGI